MLKEYFIKKLPKISPSNAQHVFNFMYKELRKDARVKELNSKLIIAQLKLSESELAVLKLSAEGADLKASAVTMSKCVSRIKQYRVAVTRKLRAKNFTNAVAIATKQNFISLEV